MTSCHDTSDLFFRSSVWNLWRIWGAGMVSILEAVDYGVMVVDLMGPRLSTRYLFSSLRLSTAWLSFLALEPTVVTLYSQAWMHLYHFRLEQTTPFARHLRAPHTVFHTALHTIASYRGHVQASPCCFPTTQAAEKQTRDTPTTIFLTSLFQRHYKHPVFSSNNSLLNP